MKIKYLSWIALALGLTIFCSQAQTNLPQPQPTSQKQESNHSDSPQDQVQLLQTELKTIKEYQHSLLDTVYWSLSAIILVTTAILGFGWFANFKVYERDKETIANNLNQQIQQLTNDNSRKIEELSKKLSDLISKKLGEAQSKLDDVVTKKASEVVQPIKWSVGDVERRIFDIELSRLQEKMKSNTSKSMALTDALNMLELCHKKAQGELPELMKFMLKTIDEGGKLTAQEITRVNAIIDSLPSQYKALSDRIRAKLVASDIF